MVTEHRGTAGQALTAISVPSASTTLAVVLGASEFPRTGNRGQRLSAPSSFKLSAEGFVSYLTSDKGLGLHVARICDLFDFEGSTAELCARVSRFANEQAADARDVIVYYIGHGIVPERSELRVAIRHTDDRFYESSLAFRDLASALRDELRAHRIYFILDCCFAGTATGAFMSDGMESAVSMLRQRLPASGVAMLCATSADTRAWAPAGSRYTMFSGALLEVLTKGVKKGPRRFSLTFLRDATRVLIQEQFPDRDARPELHQPGQREGDVGLVEVFPNPSRRQGFDLPGQWHQDVAERQIRNLLVTIEGLQAAIEKFPSSYRIDQFKSNLVLDEDGVAILERECFGITADQPVTDLEIPYEVKGSETGILCPVECNKLPTSKLEARSFDVETPTRQHINGVIRLSGELNPKTGFVGFRVHQRIENSFCMSAEALAAQLTPGDFPWEYFTSEVVTPLRSIHVTVNLPPSFEVSSSSAEPIVLFGKSEQLNYTELDRIEADGIFSVQGRTVEMSVGNPRRGNRYGITWLPPSRSNRENG
jgi:hypothetical protein